MGIILVSIDKCQLLKFDKFIKKNPTTSDGDLFQALALLIATRVYISPFDNEKILDMLFKMAKDGVPRRLLDELRD